MLVATKKIVEDTNIADIELAKVLKYVFGESASLSEDLGNPDSFQAAKEAMEDNAYSEVGAFYALKEIRESETLLYVTGSGVHLQIEKMPMNYGHTYYRVAVCVYYSVKNTLANSLKEKGFTIGKRVKHPTFDMSTDSEFAFKEFSTPFMKEKQIFFKTPYGEIPLRDIDEWLQQGEEYIMTAMYEKLHHTID